MAALAASTCCVIQEPTPIDLLCFRCYCEGMTESEAASSVLHAQHLGLDAFAFAHIECVQLFRLYARLELVLVENPSSIIKGGAPLLTFSTGDLERSVQLFYTPHLPVVRHLLASGKPLNSKLRASLDDIAEACGCRLREATRVFECLRSPYSQIEDSDEAPPLYPTLRKRFCMSEELAWTYACLLFLLSHRFIVSDPRTRSAVGHVPMDVLIDVASGMLLHWTEHAPSGSAPAAHSAQQQRQQQQMLPPRSAPGFELCSLIAGTVPSRPLLLRATSTTFGDAGGAGSLPPIAEDDGDGGDEDGFGDVGDGYDDDADRNEDELNEGEGAGADAPSTGGGSTPASALRGVRHHVSGFSATGGGAFRQTPSGLVHAPSWAPSPCTTSSLDPVFTAALRDVCARMLRSKNERVVLVSTVVAGFVAALTSPPDGEPDGGDDYAARNGGGSSVPTTPTDEASSLYGGRYGPNNGASGPAAMVRATAIARRLEPRLPALLATLRDVGLSLSSPSELRSLFDVLSARLVAPLQDAGAGPQDVGALFSALLSIDVVALLVTGLPPAAAAVAALSWRRFCAVVAFAVDRMLG